MDYYATLKPEIDAQVKDFAKSVEVLTSQISKIRKRLKDETDNAERLKGRITKLKELSGESLTGDQNSYEKFKVSLRKLTEQLRVSADMIKTLSEEVLPDNEKQLAEAKDKLDRTMTAFMAEKKPDFERCVIAKFEAFLDEPQDFFDSVKKLCAENSIPPKLRSLAINVRVRKYRLRVSENLIEIGLLPPSNRPVSNADKAPQQPAGGQTPPETPVTTPDSRTEAQTLLTGKL